MGSESSFSDIANGVVNRIRDRAQAAANGSGTAGPCTTPGFVFRRLKAKYGLGDNPDKRSALFEQIEKLHRRFPEAMEELITEAVKAAASAEHPDRYFCVAVKKRILHSGLTLRDPREEAW